MKILKKTLLFGFFTLSSLMSININADTSESLDKIFKGVEGLITTLADSEKGLIPQIDSLARSFHIIKGFTNCSKFKLDERSRKGFKVGDQTIRCTNVKDMIKAMLPILMFFESQIIGSDKSPGLMYSILNILDSLNIDKIKDVKSIVNNISKLLEITTKLLDKMEDKVQVLTPQKKATA